MSGPLMRSRFRKYFIMCSLVWRLGVCLNVPTNHSDTVYPKKHAHGLCLAVPCCGYTLTDFPISIRLTSPALWQSNDCPSAGKATLMNMDKYFMWIHYVRLHNHNKATHNKTVCIFLGVYCICVSWIDRDSKWRGALFPGSSDNTSTKRYSFDWPYNKPFWHPTVRTHLGIDLSEPISRQICENKHTRYQHIKSTTRNEL